MVSLSAESETNARRSKTDWRVINREILERLDLRSEFISLGVAFASDGVAPSGWAPCFAVDRDERNPSAAVCLSSGNGSLGKYKDHGPGGSSRAESLFDLAVRLGKFGDFKAARDYYAARAGVDIPRARARSQSVSDQVQWIDHNSKLNNTFFPFWTAQKSGVSVDVARRIGRLCRWPTKSPRQEVCIAFVAYRPANWTNPVGIILYRAIGGDFAQSKSLPARKTHLVRGSTDGLVLGCTPQELAAAHTVVKCEGVTDLLAIVPHLPAGVVAVTSACGAKSFPVELASAFAGKRLLVIHDADSAGEAGATVVATATVTVAAEVKHVRLPFEIKQSHGQDLRNFIAQGGRWSDLLAIAEKTDRATAETLSVAGVAVGDAPPKGDRVNNQVANAAFDSLSDEWLPIPMSEVLRRVRTTTGDWPRRVGRSLFVPAGRGVDWLASPPALFGWLQTECDIIDWRRVAGAVTKEEAFSELTRTSQNYVAVETLPHYPNANNHFYTWSHDEIGGTDGTALKQFLSFFEPATPTDGDLILAALLTLLWGGDGGSRPAFVITADGGRGKGKSKCAELLSRVVGGAIDFSNKEDIANIKTRLLSDDALSRRVAILDNVKSHRFSWSELEALVTAPVISGKRLYVGEGTRPNTLTWFITLNGASLSTDMAQRCVVIHLGEPRRSAAWEEDAKRFVDENREAIIADAISMLRNPGVALTRHSRWASWESAVLSHVADPPAAQSLILERQAVVDVEREEADEIEDYFGEQLGRLKYDADRDEVLIPSQVAARWYQAATGEAKSVVAAGRVLAQLVNENRLSRIRPNACRSYGRGWVWCGEHVDVESHIRLDLRERIAKEAKSSEGATTTIRLFDSRRQHDG